jgi:hypothetical protein
MTSFMPWHGLAGGILIGLGAAVYLIANGRVAGVSGIIDQALSPGERGYWQNIAFLAGLMAGALFVALLAPSLAPQSSFGGGHVILIVGGGFIVGLGARVAGGCTSGHGVCGIPRLSARSIVATLVFMATAAATVFVARHAI